MSHYQQEYPWPSLTTTPYRPLLLAGPQGYILYRHKAAVCRFQLVVLPLHVHVKGSTGVHHLCPACLVHVILIVYVIGGRWPYSCCFVGCCLQDLFNIACSILVYTKIDTQNKNCILLVYFQTKLPFFFFVDVFHCWSIYWCLILIMKMLRHASYLLWYSQGERALFEDRK